METEGRQTDNMREVEENTGCRREIIGKPWLRPTDSNDGDILTYTLSGD